MLVSPCSRAFGKERFGTRSMRYRCSLPRRPEIGKQRALQGRHSLKILLVVDGIPISYLTAAGTGLGQPRQVPTG